MRVNVFNLSYIFFTAVQWVSFCRSMNETIIDHLASMCDPGNKCSIQTINGDGPAYYYSMVDNRRKILMEFTPKADCTSAVVMFLESMGFEYGVHYKGWPHDFRIEFTYKHCGMSNWCMFFDPKWYKFKVVRNPYERAVSSYLHCMATKLLPQYYQSSEYDNISFRDFLVFLSSLPPGVMQRLAGRHASYQTTKFEREYFYKYNKTMFDAIVKAENPSEALARINTEKNTNFRLGYNSSHHPLS